MVDDQVLEALSQGCEFARPIAMLGAGGVHLPGGPAWWSGDEGLEEGVLKMTFIDVWAGQRSAPKRSPGQVS